MRSGGDTAAWLRYPPPVLAIRRFLAQRHLAALLCVATLLLKLLVPTGYMIGSAHDRLTIELCPGAVAQPMATGAMAGMPGHGKSPAHDRAEMPCAFAGLSAAAIAAIDPVQLAALILFAMAAGLLPVAAPAAVPRGHLRPPLRGPPLPL